MLMLVVMLITSNAISANPNRKRFDDDGRLAGRPRHRATPRGLPILPRHRPGGAHRCPPSGGGPSGRERQVRGGRTVRPAEGAWRKGGLPICSKSREQRSRRAPTPRRAIDLNRCCRLVEGHNLFLAATNTTRVTVCVHP